MDAPRTNHRFYSAWLAVSFMVALCLPLVSMVAGWGRGPELGEKRVSIPPPALPSTLAEWKDYPRKYEAYFNDSFGWRNWLIVGRSLLVMQGWAVHPSVLYDARSGNMFYRPDKLSGGLLLPPRDPLKRKRIVDFILRHGRQSRSTARAYLFVAVPSRLSIYPEAHPVGLFLQKQRVLDEVVRKIPPEDQDRFIDLLGVLKPRRNEPIYYRHDTHWTDLGARLGYEQIIAGLRKQGLDVDPIPVSAFDYGQEPLKGDITGLLGLNFIGSLLEVRVLPVHRESSLRALRQLDSQGKIVQTVEGAPADLLRACRDARQFRLLGAADRPRLLVFRDSCTVALVPYLAEHFSEATFIWTKPGEYRLSEWRDRTDPDVVLEIFGESNVLRL